MMDWIHLHCRLWVRVRLLGSQLLVQQAHGLLVQLEAKEPVLEPGRFHRTHETANGQIAKIEPSVTPAKGIDKLGCQRATFQLATQCNDLHPFATQCAVDAACGNCESAMKNSIFAANSLLDRVA
jgi:hypothetical protein